MRGFTRCSPYVTQIFVVFHFSDKFPKPGIPRSSNETLNLVEQQVEAACLGVAQSVKDLQTKTGVKDAFTQHWIDQLIERARIIQKDQPERSTADIQTELMEWVIKNQKEIYNPFLTMEGELIDLPQIVFP